jgi:hypothetical protein
LSVVERSFGSLKDFGRFVTRYDKFARNLLLSLLSLSIGLKLFESRPYYFRQTLREDDIDRHETAAQRGVTLKYFAPTNRASRLWKRWILKGVVNQPNDHSYKNNSKDEEHAGVWGLNIH